jgi:hypothetical protein
MAGTVIEGRTWSREHGPVVEARVYFTEAPVALPDIAALTDGDGRFSLFVPVPGKYTLECSAEGFLVATVTINVTGEKSRIDLPVELLEA